MLQPTGRRTIHIYDGDADYPASLIFRAVQIAAARNDMTFGAYIAATVLDDADVMAAIRELQERDKGAS